MPNLTGKICLVTGASRGIGRGIAIQLVGCGATCYITGRSKEKLQLVVEETKTRGYTGKCIAVECDHANDESVEKLFQQISDEQNGKLDLLVNNAYAAVKFIVEENEKPFWDQPVPESWDVFCNVGLRSHYICAVHACRMMVPKRKGLIVNISSMGAQGYFQMPQYGIGKAGKDRMAKDCSIELEKYNIAFVTLWPGAVKTELIMKYTEEFANNAPTREAKDAMKWVINKGESPEYAGKGVACLLNDPNVMKKSGSVLVTTDLASEYKFKDVDGNDPLSQRSLLILVNLSGFPRLASWIPTWIKLPKWFYITMLSLSSTKPFKLASKYE